MSVRTKTDLRSVRTKTDLRAEDLPLLDELAKAIGVDSRATANSILINKCAKHLIKWFSSDPHSQGCLDTATPIATPIYRVEPLETLSPLDF